MKQFPSTLIGVDHHATGPGSSHSMRINADFIDKLSSGEASSRLIIIGSNTTRSFVGINIVETKPLSNENKKFIQVFSTQSAKEVLARTEHILVKIRKLRASFSHRLGAAIWAISDVQQALFLMRV